MSGHSKWSTIKRKKGEKDGARAKVFTKISREILVCIKETGSADPANNSKLAALVQKAKSNNIPNDNIDRLLKKAAGGGEKNDYENCVYEGYGPGGVAVIVEALTDNKNRTAAAVRHIFDKCGGSLGTTNCVSYMFDQKGMITVERKPGDDEEEVMMAALDVGADDFDSSDDEFYIFTAPSSLDAVRAGLEKAGMTIVLAETKRIPSSTVDVDEATEVKIRRLLDMFDEDDDVQEVYHNALLPEDDADDE
ncbi:MAG: YebC/PmpR family DNA-binding transcriptional regulator [Clostridiales bacterium]|nr:YebC/PmpR family DNA-binding transcriptional regulator [Clostridiales bacterium]